MFYQYLTYTLLQIGEYLFYYIKEEKIFDEKLITYI